MNLKKTKAAPAEVPKQFKSMVLDDYKQLTLRHNPDAAWTKSKDGNDILFDSGYTYKINKPYTKKNGEEVKHLRCTVEICSAKNALNDGVLKSRDHAGHKCEPDPTKLARLDALHKAREAARSTHLKPSEICSKVLVVFMFRINMYFQISLLSHLIFALITGESNFSMYRFNMPFQMIFSMYRFNMPFQMIFPTLIHIDHNVLLA